MRVSDASPAKSGSAAEALRLPLNDWHIAKGARMVPFAGYSMPIQYEGIIAEHLWCREQAGLFDVSHMGQLLLDGEGLDAALEHLLPIDMTMLPVGQQRYSLLIEEKGGILDDLIALRLDRGVMLVVNGAMKHDDLSWIRAHMPAGVTVTHLDHLALLALQGPGAAAVLVRLADKDGALALADLGFMQGRRMRIAGIDCLLTRSGYTGEDGFEISLDAARAAELADILTSEAEVKPVGLGARDSLRLEAGLPLYGHDLDTGTGPVEAGLGFAISKRRRAEGGFIGAGPVQAGLRAGVPRKRVGLSIEGRLPAREGAEIFLPDGVEPVGRVTSGGFSPSLQQPVAMGYVPAELAAPDTPLSIEVRGKRLSARTCNLPFVPHRYYRKGASK